MVAKSPKALTARLHSKMALPWLGKEIVTATMTHTADAGVIPDCRSTNLIMGTLACSTRSIAPLLATCWFVSFLQSACSHMVSSISNYQFYLLLKELGREKCFASALDTQVKVNHDSPFSLNAVNHLYTRFKFDSNYQPQQVIQMARW